MTTEILEKEHGAGCSCCLNEPKLGVNHWLDIHAPSPRGDKHLLVLLYHNWIASDTAYLIFDQIHRILDLYPLNPLLELLIRADEDEESQD